MWATPHSFGLDGDATTITDCILARRWCYSRVTRRHTIDGGGVWLLDWEASTMLKLGLMGLKGHEGVVLDGARALGDVELVALSETDEGVWQAFRREEPLAAQTRYFADWRQMLEHTALDVCCVCDENGLRAEQLIALAERGVDVVTEKPLATTLEDLARAREAVERAGVRLTMLLTMRHEDKYPEMRRLIREGAIGTVCIATAQKSYRVGMRPEWQKTRARLGGMIPFIGVHALDLIRWVSGEDFTHIAAFHGNLGTPSFGETEDQASLLVRLSNGGSATARLDYLRPEATPTHGDDELRIAGSEGVLLAAGPYEDLLLLTENEPPRVLKAPLSENLFVDFVRARERGEPSRIPAADCFYITEVVLRGREAADVGRIVEIPPPW
jgi:predicted dehydrogenase